MHHAALHVHDAAPLKKKKNTVKNIDVEFMYRTVRMTFFSTHSSSIIRHCEPDTKQGQKNYGKAS